MLTRPPLAAGLPLLGSALALRADPLGFLLEQYLDLGPIFRVGALHRRFTVLAGPAANRFAAREGDRIMSGARDWATFAREVEAEHFLAGVDGPLHSQLRKIIKKPYSRRTAQAQLPTLVETTRRAVSARPAGRVVVVREFMQRLVAEQIGQITLGSGPGEVFDDFVVFMRNLLNAVLGQQPLFTLRFPAYRRSHRRVMDLARRLVAEHQADKDPDREPDLVDYFLAAIEENPGLISEGDLLIGVVGPYLAGIDTAAGTLSFMLYALLRDPALLARLRDEVDQTFAAGPLSAARLRDMPVLYATAIETLRMYPVAPMVPRHATCDFAFAGHRVEEGEALMLATGVAHFDPEIYAEPHRFDIERCMHPRNEHRQPGAFAPYGFGAHTCAGAGMAEVQIMVTMAALLHFADIRLAESDYRLHTTYNPSPMPDDAFRVGFSLRRAEA